VISIKPYQKFTFMNENRSEAKIKARSEAFFKKLKFTLRFALFGLLRSKRELKINSIFYS